MYKQGRKLLNNATGFIAAAAISGAASAIVE